MAKHRAKQHTIDIQAAQAISFVLFWSASAPVCACIHVVFVLLAATALSSHSSLVHTASPTHTTNAANPLLVFFSLFAPV
jgi:hypothetical protein